MDYNAIIALVYEARKIALDESLKKKIEEKSGFDYVTQVDFQISDFIKNGLKTIAPNSAFVTEEESNHKTSNDRFILDPIDGTTNLTRNMNLSTISLAHYKDGKIVFGVVFNPFQKEMWFSVKGKGAHFYSTNFGIKRLISIGVENYKEDEIHVSTNDKKTAIIDFGAGVSYKEKSSQNFKIAEKIFIECGDIRRFCSTALGLCYIASGKIDGYFEPSIKAWDYAAGSLILEEAGGMLSQWNGDKLTFNESCTIIAGNPMVYNYLKNTIKELI